MALASRSNRAGFPARRLLAVTMVAGALFSGSITVGSAAWGDPNDPVIVDPSDPDAVLAQFQDLSRQAEVTSEGVNQAQVDYDAKLAAQQAAEQAAVAAQAEVTRLSGEQAVLQVTVDKLVRANYQGARTNSLFAMLVSESPDQLLDQMSALKIVNDDTVAQVASFRQVKAAADSAAAAATTASDAATAAATEANTTLADLQQQLGELQSKADEVRALYASLTAPQLAVIAGNPLPPESVAAMIPAVPNGANGAAVQAALTKVGSPYGWGATGADEFDCSGLMVWSYNQIGRSIPRTSQAQLAGGTPVSRDQLQPGDLIGYYSGITHVAMYVGNGMVVHASTYGVPVAVVPVDSAGPYVSAVRY